MVKRRGVTLLVLAYFLICSLYLVSASQLRVTEEHPFLINNEWVSASQLEVGDLLTTIDGKKARITNIEDVVRQDPFSVYNLEAKEYSDFVVNSEGVVVHNSNEPLRDSRAGFADFNPNPNRELSVGELEELLLKPGAGNRQIARAHAEVVANRLDMAGGAYPPSNVYAENLKRVVKVHEDTSLDFFPFDQYETNCRRSWQQVEEILSDPNVLETSIDLSTRTGFKLDNPRFAQVYRDCIDNIFSKHGSNFYVKGYSYDIQVNGQTRTVLVQHSLSKYQDSVVFFAEGGVKTETGQYSLRDLTVLLDEFRNTAVTASDRAQRAAAIAEFEWIHSVTTPSSFGGGTVLMELDYKLLEQAGFANRIPRTYRRIELEALSMPRDDWIKLRTQELMTGETINNLKGPLALATIGAGTTVGASAAIAYLNTDDRITVSGYQ